MSMKFNLFTFLKDNNILVFVKEQIVKIIKKNKDKIDVKKEELKDVAENYIKNKYHLTVGTNTAEQIKINIGCASLSADKKLTYMNVSGRNQKGLSSEIKVSSSDVCEALSLSLERIAQSVRKVLENTPPELSADILDNGLTLTGGGALLRGIDLYLSQKISLPVKIADQPLDCVAAGAGKLL